MSKPTLMGKLLVKVRNARNEARRTTTDELWKRNKLDNPVKRDGYRIEEIKTVDSEGNETIKLQLWHKVDEAIVSVDTEVSAHIVKEGW